MSWTSILIGIAIWTAAICASVTVFHIVRLRALKREMMLRLDMEPRRREAIRNPVDAFRRAGSI